MRLALLKICILVLLAIHAVSANYAYAGTLSGEAEWNYADFQSSRNDEPTLKAHHFWHQYSLMYETGGKVLEGRAGAWSLSAGAQWMGLEAEFNGDFSEERFKPLYEGDLLLAPGGLPFRLHLYHRDTDLSSTYTDSRLNILPSSIAASRTGLAGILSPGIATGINNGSTVQTGASLLVGIRNGSYLGRYRNVLSRFPRLLMDYRQTVVKDLDAINPQHYRQRELAFVSLNKKDNWFHYRYSDYENYLSDGDGWTHKQYILGTITSGMRRHWIQMTNWLKVSADGSYSEFDGMGPQERRATDEFALNLMGVGRRSSWEGSTFANFTREKDTDTNNIDKRLSVPLYLNGEIDANTAWRFRFEANQDDVVEGVDEYKLYSEAELDAFREQRYRLKNEVALERESRTNGDSTRARLGLEFFNNRDFRPRSSFILTYDLSYFTNKDGNREKSFLENSAAFSMRSRTRSRFQWEFSQGLTFGTGDLAGGDSGAIQSNSGETMSRRVQTGQVARTGNVLRSTSEVGFEYSANNRHNNRIGLAYDYLSEERGSTTRFSAGHGYSYSRRGFKAGLKTSYSITAHADGEEIKEWFHRSHIRYIPSRSLKAEVSLEYEKTREGNERSSSLESEESIVYSIYKINGLIRKLWEFSQEAQYESIDGKDGRYSVAGFSLGVNYFPWQVLRLSSEVNYQRFSPADFDRMVYHFGCHLSMSKLQVGLTYSYGMQEPENPTISEQKEQRWTLSVKRVF